MWPSRLQSEMKWLLACSATEIKAGAGERGLCPAGAAQGRKCSGVVWDTPGLGL